MTNELKNELLNKIECNLYLSDELLEIVGDIFDRMATPTKEALLKAIDEEVFQYYKQWAIIQNYIVPQEIGTISYYEVEEMFTNDILYYIENLGE